MARDLNKFFAQHRKSHTRYISSVDSLIARYEDVGDNELDSVVDLSSFEVFKDKKDIFRRGKFVGSASHSVRSNEKCKDYTLKERIEEDESILPEEEDDSDPDSKNVDFQVLSDLSTCVASFLEEGEPEPSDAETLSSTSTDSYETILSDYDDTTQDSCSQEEDFKYTEKCGEDEHLYDEIDGDLYRKIDKDAPQNRTNQSKNTLPHLNSEFSERDERIHKNEEKRLDETFVIEDCKKSNINGTANAHNVKKCSRHVTAECNNSSTVDNYDIGHSEVTKQNSGHNVRNSSSQGINVRKILTHFTPFHEDDMDNRRGSVSGNYLNNKKELCINNEHGEDTHRESYTENSLFSEDSKCLDGNSNRIYEIQNNIQLEIDKLDTSKHKHSRQKDDCNAYSHRKNSNWLDRNFSPRQTSERIRTPANDLSRSSRIRGSPRLDENCSDKASVRRSNSEKYLSNDRTEAAQLSTPLHHRQARKMINSNLRSSPLPKDDTYISCNETEQESLHEDNRSSKKDSGFSTMHDESLTIDTPVYGDIPEVLTSENLDSFNKSLAEQSTFINVSVNCSDSKTEEKTEKVEKWLHDVSVEMEKESETSIDRKVNRISQEMCKNVENQRSSNKIRNGRQKHEVNRQRHNSVEIPKGNVLFFNTVVSKSCQPLQRQQRSDMNVDCQRGRPVNLNAHSEEIFGHGDRHILKVHRSLTPQFHQRLKDEQVAELMRKCGRNDDSDAFNEVTKRKHSEFSGKRYIDEFDDELENKIDVLPTPPKSRKLNGNASGPFKQRYFNGDKQYKFLGHRKVENVDNYIEKDYRKTYPVDDRQEMLAYMMQRNFPKKSPNSRAEYKHGRNTDRKDSLVNDTREIYPNREGTKKDSQHKEYQNIYHEIEDVGDQDTHANFESRRLEFKMKSPTNGNRSVMSPENKSRQRRDERNLRMKNACISPANQYGVNQSYIRKLRNSPKFEDTEDGFQSRHYEELGETSAEICKRNSNLDRNQYDFERSPRIKGRHTSRQANKRTEYNQCNRENDFNLDGGETVFEKSEQFRKECDIGLVQYSNTKAFDKHYRQTKERYRPEWGHYDEVERDETCSRHEHCENFEGSSPRVKNRSRKSNSTDQDMYTNPINYDQDEFYDMNANYKGAHGFTSEFAFEKERYSSKKIEDFNNSNRNFVDNDEEFEEENDYVSPRTQIKRYHLECHLGSPNWQRSKHFTGYRMEERSPQQQRNVVYKDNMSPSVQKTRNTPLDSEYRSPCTRRNAKEKCEDFSSPIVQRAKASSRQDEFSPSTSLAKMRLNTPKSRSEDRRRQHRRSQSRGEDCETNVDPYQKPCYQSEVCDANAAGKDNINDYSFDKEFSRKIQGQEKEMPVGNCSPTQSSQRFVSLDQIGGMPLQFRIQQLESGHSITGERRLSDRRKEFRNVECSNQYICEQSNENSEYYENEQIVHPSLEINRNSNVYHKYYEVVNERGQERDQSPVKQDSDINSKEHNAERTGDRLPTVSSEPKMRKSLFSPTYENRRQNTLSQSRKTVLQSGKGFDAFKIPMSPPVVARTKVNKHNKENEHDEKKMFAQKTKCASSEVTKTREGFSNKRYTNSGSDKMTPLQYMQSTPIKPGIQFTMNTTMSTIMGSDETEINNDANEEIVLI